MNIKHHNAAFELKGEPTDDGTFQGYASVFNEVDQGMDVVDPQAFTKSLDDRKPKMLWQHDVAQPIGVWTDVRSDEKGLFVKGRLLAGVRQGAEALELLRNGALDSMSIGYRTVKAVEEGAGRVRRLLEVELHEISLVTFPMLTSAMVTAVKSIETIRDFETTLRDAGFSRTEAKAIAANGFKGLANQRDVVEQGMSDETMTDIANHLQQLKEQFHV